MQEEDMPIYEYGCEKCGKKHEILQKASDAPKTVCPDCGGELTKLISNSTFRLKGSGWYVNDYGSTKKMDAPKHMQRRQDEKDAAESKVINNTEVPKASKPETAAK
jgi:putative FmdB family regulatory protein